MILPFSTQINGKPNYFVEKIAIGIDKHIGTYHTEPFLKVYKEKFESKPPVNFTGKLHTIREDAKNRWKTGTMIDFYINNTKPNMFRFAPRIPVVSIQEIEIIYYTDRETLIKDLPPKKAVVLGNSRLNQIEIEQLAQNDGFNTIEDFFTYFNEDFKGKLIHWTNLKY